MSNPPIELTPRPMSPRQRFLLGAGLFTAVALALQFWRIYALTATFDQGLFLQEIWSALGGRPFESTLASELSSPVLLDKTSLPTLGYLHLGQHFTPLLLLWVPLVALLGPWSLPLVQVGLISAGGLVLFELARCDLDERISCWIALSYFASGTVIGPSLENFHDLCAVPVLVFSLLLGIRRNNLWLYGTAALLLPLVREDVGLLAFSLGLWMLLRRQRWRWAGLGLCLYATAAVVLITNSVQPLFGTEVSDRLLSARFGHFLNDQGGTGSTLDLLRAMAMQPQRVLQELITPIGPTLQLIIALWLPLGFLPILGLDAWLLMAVPLFLALAAQGVTAMAVNLRFMLYLVPGVFAGSVIWWQSRQALFEQRWVRRLWQSCALVSLFFALMGNPHHSLSMLIPDSINPWVFVPPWQQLHRGYQSRVLTRPIPADASVSAETQLIPMLAERRVLLRYPFNTRYTDEQGQVHDADWIVLQPRFKSTYAPAFRRQANTLEHGMNLTRHLLKSGDYQIASCGPSGIVLKHQSTATAQSQGNEPGLAQCLNEEFERAQQVLSQRQ
jgi:uncharacterized membrane protein